jgi:hypothetical protein
VARICVSVISEPRPTRGLRGTAKEFIRLRLLALLDIPVLERKVAHDTDRLVELARAQRATRELVEGVVAEAAAGPPSNGSPSDDQRVWREAAAAIVARHQAQSRDDVLRLRAQYETPVFGDCRVFDLLERLGQCVDPTDCRLYGASQLTHVLLMIEAMEADGVLTSELLLAALVHDLGKLLLLTDEDPANVACMNAPIGHHPDGVGLDHVLVQWNHDEFAYSRLVDHVPDRIGWLVRYHSLDPLAVAHLHDERDRRYTREVLETFSHYDHATKTPYRTPGVRLEDYRDLIDEVFPDPIPF